jgi:hypothetical protein
MKTLQTTGIVTPTHQLVVDVPSDVPSGAHRVVVVLEEAATPEPSAAKWNELALAGSRWPEGGVGLSREDLYGDAGR